MGQTIVLVVEFYTFLATNKKMVYATQWNLVYQIPWAEEKFRPIILCTKIFHKNIFLYITRW